MSKLRRLVPKVPDAVSKILLKFKGGKVQKCTTSNGVTTCKCKECDAVYIDWSGEFPLGQIIMRQDTFNATPAGAQRFPTEIFLEMFQYFDEKDVMAVNKFFLFLSLKRQYSIVDSSHYHSHRVIRILTRLR